MKYIDADLLLKEIEFAKSVYSNPQRVVHGVADAFRQDGRAAMCDDILKKLDSLQQDHLPDAGKKGQLEKPKKSCYGCPHCVEKKDQNGWHFKACFGGPYNGKFIGEIDECPLKQEQPEVELEGVVDLEKEIIRYQREDMDRDTTVGDVARHFYELGKKQ